MGLHCDECGYSECRCPYRITSRNYKKIDMDELYRQIDMKGTGASIHELRSHAGIIGNCIALMDIPKPKTKRNLELINLYIKKLAARNIYVKVS